MDNCVNCGEPLYIRKGHDIRVFHAQFPEFRKTKKGRNCKDPKMLREYPELIEGLK